MDEYALVGPADEIKTFAHDVKPDVGTKAGWRWLPAERMEDPHDPQTELLEPESVTIEKGRVLIERRARAKTAEELQREAEERIDDVLPPALLSIIADLEDRLRALEGKSPRSEEEFRAALRQRLA
jgi:hypothetical protein